MTSRNSQTAFLRETFQPSLWDRLVDDSPGLAAEIERRRDLLSEELDADRLAELEAGGVRAIEAQSDLTDGQKKQLHLLLQMKRSHQALEERGVVVSPDVLREAVRRDLEALFNTERLEANYLLTDHELAFVDNLSIELEDFPHIRRSVINFGVPAFSGKTAGGADRRGLEKEIKEVVATFEPRLRRDSIKVNVRSDPKEGLKIDIDAVLIMTPTPERLKFRTSIDLENGQAETALETV